MWEFLSWIIPGADWFKQDKTVFRFARRQFIQQASAAGTQKKADLPLYYEVYMTDLTNNEIYMSRLSGGAQPEKDGGWWTYGGPGTCLPENTLLVKPACRDLTVQDIKRCTIHEYQTLASDATYG